MKKQNQSGKTKRADRWEPDERFSINMDAASDKDQLHALLYEALETEQNGVLVYESALKCAINDDLVEEWEKYSNQTKNHVTILTNVIKKLGMNPDQDTPGRTLSGIPEWGSSERWRSP